jgi:hypothetical protein
MDNTELEAQFQIMASLCRHRDFNCAEDAPIGFKCKRRFVPGTYIGSRRDKVKYNLCTRDVCPFLLDLTDFFTEYLKTHTDQIRLGLEGL